MNSLVGKTVFVGLSGGVDSSVAAAMLQEAGAQVHGVFIQGWYPPDLKCTWREDREDAMRVAAHLQIPFSTLDASVEYKRYVIDYLLAEYKVGRTPNPDIMCNKEVKFGAFFQFARKHGADFVATGHYAQCTGEALLRGADSDKDQSYFLWALTKELLPYILFPLGTMHKSEVRERARAYQLPTAHKKDSQGICFLGQVSIDAFLSSEYAPEEGSAYTVSGDYVGTHKGSLLYTLGERAPIAGGISGPWYVIRKDIEKNELYVSHTLVSPTPRDTVTLSATNYSSVPTQDILEAQYRYHGPKVQARLDTTTDTITFESPLTEVLAPGQSLVLYQGEKLIGGGIIES